jgi:hypothetical protein
MDRVEENISMDVGYFLENTGKIDIQKQNKYKEWGLSGKEEAIDFPEDMDVSDFLPVDDIARSVENTARRKDVVIPEDDDADDVPYRYRSQPVRRQPGQRTASGRRQSTRTQTGQGQSGRSQAARTQAGQGQSGRSQATRTQAGQGQGGRSQTVRTQTGQNQNGRSQTARTQTGQNQNGRSQTTRTQAGSGKNDRSQDARSRSVQDKNVRTQEKLTQHIQEEAPVREKSRPKKKKKIGSILVGLLVVVVVAAVIGGAYMLIFGRDNAKFNSYYENAQSYYDKESWQAAVSEFIRADNAASTTDQHIKAKEMLWKTYEKMGDKESEEITVLEALVGLNGDEVSYYEALLALYQKTDNVAKIENLLEKVKGTSVGDDLEEYDFSTPVPSVAEGEYDEPIKVELTSVSGNTIYYTTNGKEPTEKSKQYKKAITFGKNGEFTLKAIAVNSMGIKSDVMTVTYKINAITAPEVEPASGDYTEFKTIEIEVQEGVEIYYTLDGTKPDKNSTKYTKAFDMPVGNTVLSVVAYNSANVASDVVTRVYNLVPYRTYSYNAALDVLITKLVAAGLMENLDGTYSDDTEMKFEYVETAVIKQQEYYIITAKHNTITTYAVSCSDGSVYRAEAKKNTYKLTAGVE